MVNKSSSENWRFACLRCFALSAVSSGVLKLLQRFSVTISSHVRLSTYYHLLSRLLSLQSAVFRP
ncbi:hypothetical protein KC19_6G169900 [Ceratodon purpureus]|uniref:Uncharacterized protein n=1 Tax=Ceratodon purpureus TaxID=3225 RepID=A0A8T0HGR3_CERPU|nr:hypothetical protein KC19_6G169900 [Ceratodon purpureus]